MVASRGRSRARAPELPILQSLGRNSLREGAASRCDPLLARFLPSRPAGVVEAEARARVGKGVERRLLLSLARPFPKLVGCCSGLPLAAAAAPEEEPLACQKEARVAAPLGASVARCSWARLLPFPSRWRRFLPRGALLCLRLPSPNRSLVGRGGAPVRLPRALPWAWRARSPVPAIPVVLSLLAPGIRRLLAGCCFCDPGMLLLLRALANPAVAALLAWGIRVLC